MGQCAMNKKLERKSFPNTSVAFSDFSKISKKYPSRKSQQMIRASLLKHNILANVTNDDFFILLREVNFYVYTADQIVFEQGDQGNLFYIVENGKLAVIRNGVKKTILQRGDNFGDMAILTDYPRRATIKTIEESSLWGIERSSFLQVVQILNGRKASENKKFISELKLFNNLPDNQLEKLSQVLIQQEFPDSTRVICEGDEGILLHIIKTGEAIVKLHGSEMFRLISGEMFGESAVLGLNRINQFSVYSVGKLVVLSLSIKSIEKILGEDFKTLLHKNQAKNSILSNKYFKFMSRENVDMMVEKLEWKIVQVGSEPLLNPIENSIIYVLAYGTLSCEEVFFNQYQIIGFIDEKKKLLKGQLKVENEVVIGSISINTIEEIMKMPFNTLKNRLKIMKTLKKLEFFNGISQRKLRFIADSTVKVKFENKELIYKFNDEAKGFYIIKSGSVKIYQNRKTLRVLGKYDIFGDNCLLEKTRSTNAKSLSHCKCLLISGEDFKEIINNHRESFMLRSRSSLSLFHLNELVISKFIKKDDQRHCFLTFVLKTDTFYYVEVLDKDSVISSHSFEKLLHEKKIAIQIDHPLIMRMMKTFSDSRFIYMVYENFTMISLISILDKPLTEDQSKFLTAALVDILECLHEKLVIYREFDPISLSLTKKGYPFISTFRSAKMVKEWTKTALGNLEYCAPEQIIGKRYNKSVNFWSLGVMIYQFLYGQLPFDVDKSENPFDCYQKIIKANLEFPQNSKFFRANELIARLLDADAEKRAGLDEVKHSRWLDAVDWQRISTNSFESPLSTSNLTMKTQKPKDDVSLTRYLHETYSPNIKSSYAVIVNQKKQINWDRFF
jgi:CRP-like cAMP-binding protein